MAKKQAMGNDVPFDPAKIQKALEDALANGVGKKEKKEDKLLPFKDLILKLAASGASATAIAKVINQANAGINVADSLMRAFLATHTPAAPAPAKPAAVAPVAAAGGKK